MKKAKVSMQSRKIRPKRIAGRKIDARETLMPRAPARNRIQSKKVAGRKIDPGQVLTPRAPAKKKIRRSR